MFRTAYDYSFRFQEDMNASRNYVWLTSLDPTHAERASLSRNTGIAESSNTINREHMQRPAL